MPFAPQEEPGERQRLSRWMLAAAVASCVLQLLWFAPKCWHEINFDGMAYLGIARHLRQGELDAALNAFRSPLLSWLIALASLANSNYLAVGKLVNAATFIFCARLLYLLTLSLWKSKLAAAVSVLIFTLGRGLTVEAVASVNADFLLSGLALLYFIVLLRCLRQDRPWDWFLLGGVHGLAFLAKAIALPWLGMCTLIAVVHLPSRIWKVRAARLASAAAVPLIFAAGWAGVLHSKYGVYTTGSQFKENLLQWTLHLNGRPSNRYGLLRDVSNEVDEYTVDDPMPPRSWAWNYHPRIGAAAPKMLSAEKRNLPAALKELTIVVTPGVLLAFAVLLTVLTAKRSFWWVEWRIVAMVTAAGVALVGAYCALVFDPRYIFPLVPLVLAVASGFLVADPRFHYRGLRMLSIGLAVLGIAGSLVYRASPFRVLTRDFQVASYRAGTLLKQHAARLRLVSIGSGPFPERGVGWEAGYQAAYFGGARLVATMGSLPTISELPLTIADLDRASPDAILVWGKPGNREYDDLLESFRSEYLNNSMKKIDDPVLGEVGMVVFTGHPGKANLPNARPEFLAGCRIDKPVGLGHYGCVPCAS
jgi:hypothetical protein